MNFFEKFINNPYIIAEIGSNFDQDFIKLKKLIELSKWAGANAVKVQLFNSAILYPDKKSKSYKIFKSIELKKEWIPKIIKICKVNNIDFFASTFDKESTDFLVKKKIKMIKIASSESGKWADIINIAKTNLPTIFSTGMSDLTELSQVVDIFNKIKNQNLCLMHTTSLYPPKDKEVNLKAIKNLKDIFKIPVGFSDHTVGYESACIAVAMGATIFEKHITLNKKSKGPDHFFATEPNEFKIYVKKIKKSVKLLGSGNIEINEKVKKQTRKKSLFWNKNIIKNKIINHKDIFVQSNSAEGLPEWYKNYIIGSIILKSVKKNTPISLMDFKKSK